MDGVFEQSKTFLDYKTFLFGILLQVVVYEFLAIGTEKGKMNDVTITKYIHDFQRKPWGRAFFISLWSWLTYHFIMENRKDYAPELNV